MDLLKHVKKGQGAFGAAMGFVLLGLAIIMGIVGYLVLFNVIAVGTNTTSGNNFTGINSTIATYVPTLFLVGVLVTGAMAAFVAMRGFGHE